MISRGGRYYIGGGTFKFSDEEIFNASDISEHTIRVTTRLGTAGRNKRNVESSETKRMIGKFTDFYIWNKVLSRAQVKLMVNCSAIHRYEFNDAVKVGIRPADIFDPNRRIRKSLYDWAGRNVLYAWSVETISLQRPASLKLTGLLCGKYTFTVTSTIIRGLSKPKIGNGLQRLRETQKYRGE